VLVVPVVVGTRDENRSQAANAQDRLGVGYPGPNRRRSYRTCGGGDDVPWELGLLLLHHRPCCHRMRVAVVLVASSDGEEDHARHFRSDPEASQSSRLLADFRRMLGRHSTDSHHPRLDALSSMIPIHY